MSLARVPIRLALGFLVVALAHTPGACGARRVAAPLPTVGPAPSAATCPVGGRPRGQEMTWPQDRPYVTLLHHRGPWRHLAIARSPVEMRPLPEFYGDGAATITVYPWPSEAPERIEILNAGDSDLPFVPVLRGRDGRPVPTRSVFVWTNPR